ncbi:hypothetical protein JWG39_08005, partial [Desulforhopalus vacuolatus]|uniref:hypothetical protein n=1 Tax=Desulforhopalus vacuolatus TaxID=40414 RepID=UPI0019636CF1
EDSFLQVVRARFFRITKTCSLKSKTSRAHLFCYYSVFKDRYFSSCNQEDAVRIPLCNRSKFLPNSNRSVNTFYFLFFPAVCFPCSAVFASGKPSVFIISDSSCQLFFLLSDAESLWRLAHVICNEGGNIRDRRIKVKNNLKTV